MKKIILISVIFLIAIGVTLFFNKQKLFSPKKIHYHAGFQVYVDGKLQDFSDTRYMNLAPCNGHENHGNDQEEKAHLHENVGDVVHVHRENVTWNDLFINLHFPFDSSKGIEGYSNGKKINTILQQTIKPYERVIIFIGKHENISTYLPHAVTKQHIQDVEKTSELCGS